MLPMVAVGPLVAVDYRRVWRGCCEKASSREIDREKKRERSWRGRSGNFFWDFLATNDVVFVLLFWPSRRNSFTCCCAARKSPALC